MGRLDKACQRAVDDFNRKNAHRIRNKEFEPGTWVLVHETWLDLQHGNKGAARWTGPYVIVLKLSNHSYMLRELDGTPMRSTIHGDRLKLFYYRPDHQSPTSAVSLSAVTDRYLLHSTAWFDHQDACSVFYASKYVCYESGPHGCMEEFFDNAGDLSISTWSLIILDPDLDRWPYRRREGNDTSTNWVELNALAASLLRPHSNRSAK
ncbi:hypothetical protein C8Q80DRAFT_1275390 [Daedaleopsis nitida]|nr:hypothetical protein C8Q80DRAFT_1275390 [Daedaleopsis nitida]